METNTKVNGKMERFTESVTKSRHNFALHDNLLPFVGVLTMSNGDKYSGKPLLFLTIEVLAHRISSKVNLRTENGMVKAHTCTLTATATTGSGAQTRGTVAAS